MSYIPLDYAKKASYVFDAIRTVLKERNNRDVFANYTEETLVNYLLSSNFCSKNGDKELNSSLWNLFVPFIDRRDKGKGQSLPVSQQGTYYKTEMRDDLLLGFITKFWRYNKQVYKLDRYFAEALIRTDNLTITKEQVEHLPSKTFYLDLSEIPGAKPIHGMYVYVNSSPTECSIASFFSNPRLKPWDCKRKIEV